MAFVSPNTWRAWKDLCSVAACEPVQRQELHSVIVGNLREAVSQWEAGLPDYSDEELAQRFDDYFKLGIAETGARSKDGLFGRFADVTDETEWAKRITGYIRQIARKRNSVAAFIARHEGRTGPITPKVSAEELGEADALLDPKVRPDELAAVADLKAVARQLAPGFFATLNSAQKAVLWVYAVQKDEDIGKKASLNDPKLIKMAERSQSGVYVERKKMLRRLESQLIGAISAEPDVIHELAGRVILAMLPLAEKWGSTRKSSD